VARILLIDDEPTLLDAMHEVLANAGHEVTPLGDGREVFTGDTGSDFDLVVTDLIMPGAEGIETLSHLLELNPDIKVVAISGGGSLGTSFYLKLAADSGAVRTLAKPFKLRALVDTVDSLLHDPPKSGPAQ
jgi:DNA-binding NtrC family response regulator